MSDRSLAPSTTFGSCSSGSVASRRRLIGRMRRIGPHPTDDPLDSDGCGLLRSQSEPAVTAAFDEAMRHSLAAGAEIVPVDDPVDFEQILKDHRIVMAAEAADDPFRMARRVPRRLPASDPRARSSKAKPCRRSRTTLTAEARHGPGRQGTARATSTDQRCNFDALITPATVSTAPTRPRPAIPHSTRRGVSPGFPPSRFRSGWPPMACPSRSNSSGRVLHGLRVCCTWPSGANKRSDPRSQ